MTIKNHPIYKHVIKEYHLDFGDFYFFKNVVVSEIHEEVLFNWEKAKIVIELAEALYGKGCQPYYISNRVHNYSIMAKDWLRFFKNKYMIKGYYIVTNHKSSLTNLMFEKIFFGHNSTSLIQKFHSLDDALKKAKLTDTEQ